MEQVDDYQAKPHFSQLLDRVEAGEEIIIGRTGRPVARLAPYRETRADRQPAAWRGRVQIAADFDELPEELRRAFDGEV